MNLEANLTRLRPIAASGGSDLAHLPPFRLGPLTVEPGLRRLVGLRGEARTIQPLAMRVLLVLADARDETSSRDDLVEACWNQRIVGDDAVHRIISTLRRDLARCSGGAVAIETIAKVGYRLRVGASDQDVSADNIDTEVKPGRLAKSWPAAAVAIAVLASAALFVPTRGVDGVTAIAVVADSKVADDETEQFANGLTGDLARLASAMPSLNFVEPGGARARETLLLRVALESDARTPKARVRLIDGEGGTVVWSREFAAEAGTLGELRERVAHGITGVLQCGLDRSAAFDDPVGLRIYLGACEGLETGDFARARAFAEQITKLHPNVPAGWACLANSTIFSEAQNGQVSGAVLAQADAYARRALAVDPTSGLAYVALAMVSSWRGEPVLEILERGIRADPDFGMLHKHLAWALSGAGMARQAVDPALRAVALQPHDPGLYQLAVATLLNAGRTEEAVALTAKMHRLWRYDRGVEMQRLDMLFYAPDAKAALTEFRASPRSRDPRAGAIHQTLIWRADPQAYDWAQFDRAAKEMTAVDESLAWRLSLAAARMGDQARALKWLERAPSKAFLAWSSLFAPEAAALRRDPKFFDKMASVGMVSRWQKSGRWPDFCAEPGLGYDCRTSAVRIARNSSPGR